MHVAIGTEARSSHLNICQINSILLDKFEPEHHTSCLSLGGASPKPMTIRGSEESEIIS